jgi:hypothetical protein
MIPGHLATNLLAAASGFTFPPEAVKHLINQITAPSIFLTICSIVFVLMFVLYKWWTKPLVAGIGFALFIVAYFGSMGDANFRSIVAKPDNVPITMMVLGVMICFWIAFRRAAINDTRIAGGMPPLEEDRDDRVLVWPDLVYTELICLIIATAGLTLWAIVSKAPLEQPANPGYAPNPAKAPWYFLGLQEMLVYFDPWLAGVVLPGLIIVGLIAIPYIDRNPKGNGYYTFAERKAEITLFLFGFVILWSSLIVLGTFLRGPNWNFFGPFEFWDLHKLEALVNVNLSEYIWMRLFRTGLPTNWFVREIFGILLVLGYVFVLPVVLAKTVFRTYYEKMGGARFYVGAFLFLMMMSLPIKMLLRWIVDLKYIVAINEFFFNI